MHIQLYIMMFVSRIRSSGHFLLRFNFWN